MKDFVEWRKRGYACLRCSLQLVNLSHTPLTIFIPILISSENLNFYKLFFKTRFFWLLIYCSTQSIKRQHSYYEQGGEGNHYFELLRSHLVFLSLEWRSWLLLQCYNDINLLEVFELKLEEENQLTVLNLLFFSCF